MLRILLLVGLGGAVGSVLRYLVSIFVNKHFSSIFPYATLAANVLGCIIIGILIGLLERHNLSNSDLKYIFITGFCGGFTTFSTFASENYNLLSSGNSFTALMYIFCSLLIGILGVWAGLCLARI